MYLIDTHVLIWMYSNPEKFPSKIEKVLSDPLVKLKFSIVSLWEISIKYSLGKLQFNNNITPSDLLDQCLEWDIEIVDLSAEVVTTLYNLKADFHKDPFDRMLIWQALNSSYTIISSDQKIKQYESIGLKVLW